MNYRLLILIVLFLSANSMFAENNWKLELEKEGIKVYTRASANSDFKEFKGETIIKTTIPEIEKTLTTIEKYPEWCYKTTSATVIDKDSTIIRYFLVTKTPSFLKTRVACFEFRRETNYQTGEVIYYLNDIKCNKPLSDEMLLIPIMKGFYKLTPLGNGNVQVTMQMLTEPGGIIPSWLANLVVVDSPYITLKNLSERVKFDNIK
jgi:hypothetical protein